MALPTSPLVRTLGTNESFQVDMVTLTLHVHKLMLLSSPFVRFVRLLDKLHKWESSGVSLFILVSVNLMCFVVPAVYHMTFVLGLVVMVGGLGVAHRRTQCLSKVFPPVYVKQDDLMGLDGVLTREEIVTNYKAMLYRVDTIVKYCNDLLIYFYAVLKWDNLTSSIRWFSSSLVLLLCLHILPLRCTVVMAINIFLLEGKITSVIQEKTSQWHSSVTVTEVGAGLGNEDSISWGSEDSLGSGGTNLTVPTDSDSDLSDNQDDYSDLSDSETAMSQDQGQRGKFRSGRGSAVVNKILELKKKHQNATSGSCVGCGVNFSSFLKRRHLCSHCGNHFCSRCCSYKVPRSLFGATAPAAQTETVPVCGYCHTVLTGSKMMDKPKVI